MHAATTFPRTPLAISAGNLTAGPVQVNFRTGDRESLLHSYLVMVRRLRGQLREPTITLRNADISALAEHLGASEELVLGDLLDRMGATRAQRKALLAMFAVGALSIVATGSVALELSSGDALADSSIEAPTRVEAVEAVQPSAPAVVSVNQGSLVEPALPAISAAEPVAVPQAELAIAVGGDDWEYTLSLQQLAHALSTQPPAQVASAAGEGVGVADDGSVVAVGQPPQPSSGGVGVAGDGSVVAVGQPPVPPAEGIGVADDGSVVGVATPPVP